MAEPLSEWSFPNGREKETNKTTGVETPAMAEPQNEGRKTSCQNIWISARWRKLMRRRSADLPGTGWII